MVVVEENCDINDEFTSDLGYHVNDKMFGTNDEIDSTVSEQFDTAYKDST